MKIAIWQPTTSKPLDLLPSADAFALGYVHMYDRDHGAVASRKVFCAVDRSCGSDDWAIYCARSGACLGDGDSFEQALAAAEIHLSHASEVRS